METEETEATKPIEPDWWFVAVDQTSDWHLKPELMLQVDKILTVFLFDRRRHVHCCEITPSYECWPVNYVVICKETVTERQREEINGDVNAMLGSEEVTYYHVGYIEHRMKEAGVWAADAAPDKAAGTGLLFGPVKGMEFAFYGESGVPLSATNDDLEKAIDEQRDAVMEWYHQREVF